MKPKTLLFLAASHVAVLGAGFAAGIYALPIITAEPSPSFEASALPAQAQFEGQFRRDLKDSDFLHWGEGDVFVSNTRVVHIGELAPGPDYKLYLSPRFIETEAEFNEFKASMRRVGEVKSFNNFEVTLANDVDVSAYNTVIVWCETFGQFITAAQYRP